MFQTSICPTRAFQHTHNQVVIVAVEQTMERHQQVVRALSSRKFPLATLVQFLVDYIVAEEIRVSQQMQPLLLEWETFIEQSSFDVLASLDILRSPAFDAFFYDFYHAIGVSQDILTAPSRKGVVSEFVFDGWVGLNFRLRRQSLVPECRYPDSR